MTRVFLTFQREFMNFDKEVRHFYLSCLKQLEDENIRNEKFKLFHEFIQLYRDYLIEKRYYQGFQRGQTDKED